MQKGRVYLIGAGPGDPDLITVKAVKCLEQADVVLTDRLVSEEILRRYASHAQIIYVGKQCRRGVSTPQQTINSLLVEYALKGRRVVRLKGGDVSVFSNILDELEVLTENEIPYEIVPGITAASGAASYAGIPLTARGYSTAIRFLTFYKKEVVSEDYWKELAATDDTLVFYMSSETLSEVAHHLKINNIPGDRMLAVVEQATTPYQKVYTGNLYDETLTSMSFKSPSLVIIGKVVLLHKQFAWLDNSKKDSDYFKNITSPVFDLAETKKNVSRA